MIKVISNTSFFLHGLPKGLYASLDDEAYYSGDDGRAERSRDLFGDWLFDRDYDTYIDESGDKQRWYSGFDYPEPTNRVTREMEPELEREFFLDRIRSAAQGLPEGIWLVSQGLWDDRWLESYKPDGTIIIELEAKCALQFKLTF